jgi:Ca2+-dependent lipid-binding protein
LVLTRCRAPGEEYRTGTKKGTYDPEWNERVELGWCESARQAEELGNIVMRVMDADLTSKDEHIGEARLDAGVVHLRKVGEESEVTVEIVDSEGAGVVGEDGEVGEVTLLIGIERSFGAALVAPAEEEAWVANERRRLVVTVVSASHLPKMDMLMGKCDPFAVVRMGGKEYKTGTKKGTYDPEWNERVELGWSKRGPDAGSLLKVVLYDEDLTGKDEIGEASLDACLLHRLRVGEEKEVVLGVVDGKGAGVVGKDKLGSEVKLKVKLERSVLGLVALSESQEAWVPNERRRIVATVVRARHLKKMDVMGKVDPYVVFESGGECVLLV